MKLGFLTTCLPESDLTDIARWAAGQGFEALEVAGWPSPDDRNHIRVDRFDDAERDRVGRIFAETGLTLSSIAYYENNLHPEQGAQVNAHVRRCVDAAAALGCPTVGTFVGRDPGLPVADNLKRAADVFGPLVEYATRHGVEIVIENCVMKSHPVAALRPHLANIAHVQAKDTEFLPGKLDRYGFHGPISGEKGWYRFRVPGLGRVDWTRVIDALYEGGYDGVVSVEHEDPVWSGSTARVHTGLGIAYRTLRHLMPG